FQAEDGIRDRNVTGVQTCALPISCEPPILRAWWWPYWKPGFTHHLLPVFRQVLPIPPIIFPMMAHERGSHSRISLPIRILEIGARFYAARAYFTPNIFTSTPATKECPWSLIGQRFIAIQHSFVLVASIFFPAKQCGGATKIPQPCRI